jgi:hypothetical protein
MATRHPHASRPRTRRPLRGIALAISCLGASLAACSSASESATSSSEDLIILRSHVWAYGQPGNSPAQTASSPNDMQFLCPSGTGLPPSPRPADYVWDTAAPYSSTWAPLSMGTPPTAFGTHATIVPGPVSPLATTGPQSLSAFWVDVAGDLWTADQNGGAWGKASVLIGPQAFGGNPRIGPSQRAATSFPVASVWVNPSTQLVFWVAQDGSVWEGFRGQTWGGSVAYLPTQVAPAGSAAGPIDAMAKSSTHADVVWVTPSGTLVDAWWDAGVNSSYTFTQSPIPGSTYASVYGGISLLVGGPHDGDLSVFWVTSGRALMQTVNDAASNSWKQPIAVSYNAAVDTAVSAVTTHSLLDSAATNGSLEVVWVAPDGTLFIASNDRDGWGFNNAAPGTWGSMSLTGSGAASHDPLAITSRDPWSADVYYVDPNGNLTTRKWSIDSTTRWQTWSDPLQIGATACQACGVTGGYACNANPASCPTSCPSETVLGTPAQPGMCAPCRGCGYYGQPAWPACYDGSGHQTVCLQPGTVADSIGQCTCDETDFKVTATDANFNLYVAPGLNQITVNVTNDVLTVSIPPNPGNISAPGAITLKNLSGFMTTAFVTSLNMPGDGAHSFTWSMTPGTWGIDIATTLTATIGISSVACGATLTMTNAPVDVFLAPASTASGLRVDHVALGASDPGNMHLDGCGVIGGDIEGQAINSIQSALSTQFTNLLNQNPGILTTILTTLANTNHPLDPGHTLITTLPAPAPTPDGFAWVCKANIVDGAGIEGDCWRVCKTH